MVAFQPKDFRADGLRCQGIAAGLQDRRLAYPGIEVGDLFLGPRVDAVKDTIHQGISAGIDRQHAGSDGRGGDGGDLVWVDTAVGQKLADDPDGIAPPVFFGAMLGPARARHDHFVRVRGLGDDFAV